MLAPPGFNVGGLLGWVFALQGKPKSGLANGVQGGKFGFFQLFVGVFVMRVHSVAWWFLRQERSFSKASPAGSLPHSSLPPGAVLLRDPVPKSREAVAVFMPLHGGDSGVLSEELELKERSFYFISMSSCRTRVGLGLFSLFFSLSIECPHIRTRCEEQGMLPTSSS